MKSFPWPIKVVLAARRRRDPHLDIPTRSLSNVKFNRRKRFIEMGKNTNRRLTVQSLSSEKLHADDAWLAVAVNNLLSKGKNTSIRGLYYMLKHTIEGTKENTFEEQSECDPVIEDVEGSLGKSPRRAASLRG